MKKILLTIFLLFGIQAGILGQQNNSRLLTLDQAIEIALEQNNSVQIAKYELDKSYSKLTEARGNLLPKINASGQYTHNLKKPVIFLPPGTPFSLPGRPAVLEIGSDHSYSGILSASLPIFAYQIYSAVSLASKGVDLAEESYQATKAKTVADVKKAFYSVLLAREFKSLMQASMMNATDNLENVKKLQKQGIVSEYDLIRAEVQVENIKPIVLQADNNYELAKNSLKLVLGLGASENIEVQGELKYVEEDVQKLSEILNLLEEKNPDLRQVDLQVKMAKEMITLEKTNHLPTLAAFGSYQYQTQANDFKFKDYYWVNTQFIGLQLQIPIFNGWGTQAKVDQANVSYQQSLERKRLVTESVYIQAQNNLYRIEQAIKRITGQDKAIEQATRGYEIAKSRYNNGLATQLEVNDAELAQTQSKVNYYQAVYDYLVAKADMEQLLGTIR